MNKFPANNIKLLALDVDGILTDGKIIIDSEGREIKVFSAQDGMGIKAAIEAGIIIAFITSRNSKAVQIRASELGVNEIYLGNNKKIDAIFELARKYGISTGEICYMGDDLIDLQALTNVGWGVTVPQAPDELRNHADYITRKSCGDGAVREVIELILKQNGLWEDLVKKYLGTDQNSI